MPWVCCRAKAHITENCSTMNCTNMENMVLLRIDGDKRKKCYSAYRRDKFYYLPEPALSIVNFCQKLSRDRLLRRDDILGAIAMRIEVRSKFLAWKVTAIVRIKQRRRIMSKYLTHWHAQQKDTRLFKLYKKIYHGRRLKLLREKLNQWHDELKVNKMLMKVIQRCKLFYFRVWAKLCQYQHQLCRQQEAVQRRRLAKWLHCWQRACENCVRRRAICAQIAQRMLTATGWWRWSTLCVSRRHRRELLFSLFQKKLLGLFNRWKLALRLEVLVNHTVVVPELPACLSPQASRTPRENTLSPVPSPGKALPPPIPMLMGLVPCKCIKQIKAGFRCISCSRQAHLARRLQLCRTEVDGLYSDACARTAESRSRHQQGVAANGSIASSSSAHGSIDVNRHSSNRVGWHAPNGSNSNKRLGTASSPSSLTAARSILKDSNSNNISSSGVSRSKVDVVDSNDINNRDSRNASQQSQRPLSKLPNKLVTSTSLGTATATTRRAVSLMKELRL